MGDGHPYDQQQEISIAEDGQKLVTSEDFEVRIIEPAQPGGNWEAKAAIKMHMTENALTVRIVSIKVSIFPQFLDLPLTSRFNSNIWKWCHQVCPQMAAASPSWVLFKTRMLSLHV